jgi:peptidoglycan/LPS O-acetylase OafA/YrhL
MRNIGSHVKAEQSSFRADIEGLRGIAVLIVVAFHCRVPGISGGFTGVDVFFVLSGYLITGLLVTEIEKTSRLSLLQFYSRRMRRLLPASALTLIVSLILGFLISGPDQLSFAGRAGRATALYTSNIFFGRNAADYFSPTIETNPLLHTWSLAVEEQFYMIWPLLIMASLIGMRSKKALIAVLSSLTLISLGVSIWTTANAGTFAFYQLPARAWEFAVGGLGALCLGKIIRMPAPFWITMGWLGISIIISSAFWIPPGPNFPGWVALAPVLGTVTALMAGAELPLRGAGKLLGSSPLQFLGKTSYSWYLWHWPFLVLAETLRPEISVTGKLAVSGLALLIAAVTHRFVENPIRFHPILIQRPWRTVAMAVSLTAVSLATAIAFTKLAYSRMEKPEMRRIIEASVDVSRLSREKCMVPLDSPYIQLCDFGDTRSQTRMVLFGDSHAIQWFNPLEIIARERGWRLTTLVKMGCPAADIHLPVYAKRADSCDQWRLDAFRLIDTMKPAVVIVASASVYIRGQQSRSYENTVSLEQWRQGTERTLRRLSAKNQVVMIRDNPLPLASIPLCLGRKDTLFPAESCEMVRDECLNPAVFDAEKAAARNLKNVHLLDMSDQLCEGNVCWAVKNGEVMYRDDNHLTGRFADSLRPILEMRLASFLGWDMDYRSKLVAELAAPR